MNSFTFKVFAFSWNIFGIYSPDMSRRRMIARYLTIMTLHAISSIIMEVNTEIYALNYNGLSTFTKNIFFAAVKVPSLWMTIQGFLAIKHFVKVKALVKLLKSSANMHPIQSLWMVILSIFVMMCAEFMKMKGLLPKVVLFFGVYLPYYYMAVLAFFLKCNLKHIESRVVEINQNSASLESFDNINKLLKGFDQAFGLHTTILVLNSAVALVLQCYGLLVLRHASYKFSFLMYFFNSLVVIRESHFICFVFKPAQRINVEVEEL